MTLRYKDISEIISLVDSSSCDEFVLETDEVKLVLRRRGAGLEPSPGPAPVASSPASSGSQAAGSAPVTKTAAPQSSSGAASSRQTGDAPGVVCAPMVGTFYRAPSPDDPVFVEVGSKVKAGDPLCVIEVMKLFTTIHAEAAGAVREIGAENAQLVEYGQMLFVIEPD